MKRLTAVLYFLILVVLVSCSGNKHFITDSTYRKLVDSQFESRRRLAIHREKQLFEVFNRDLTLQQEEALKFLYAYMPLSDLADYNGDYFLAQINLAFLARDSFNWGKQIPENVFRHFVLPVRVNNENLDTSRVVFFKELKDRVKNLSMKDAALEVNHWCHEKVNYRGSDARTSSPLASVRTSFGRCGEESTFTVAAMRSVGIPARQVYTPRWAHTDDNHAWVEVFVDGKWQYLGACEPEAILNKGWFDSPVKRAMMVHTNVLGIYNTDENIIDQTDLYTKINSLSTYTTTKLFTVKVENTDGTPADSALVDFGLYNYAEFYPIVSKKTDSKGLVQIITGLGDLRVWASKDGLYGYSYVSVEESDTLKIILKEGTQKEYVEKENIIPPIEKVIEEVPVATQEENNRRLAYEDSIRNAYMATFMGQEEAAHLAQELRLDSARVKRLIALSYGNWSEIVHYLTVNHKVSGDNSKPDLLKLLEVIAEKDVRDTPSRYLTDHLINTSVNTSVDVEIFNEGILSARILNENIKPWRSFLQGKFDQEFKKRVKKDISVLTKWIIDSITLSTTENYMGCPLTPIGVYELRVSDERSKNIFFVAVCRSFGIPARVDYATLIPQVYENNQWTDVFFEKDSDINYDSNITAGMKVPPPTVLCLTNNSENAFKPEYYIHYSLQKLTNGRFITLDYEGSDLVANFPVTLSLSYGYYNLMTGHRREDGSIFTRSEYFIMQGDTIKKQVIMEPLEQITTIYGKIDLDQQINTIKGSASVLKDIAGDKGIVLAFINPGNEPTRHVMSDIPIMKADFDKWGGGFVFAIPENIDDRSFNPGSYQKLPTTATFIKDADSRLLNEILKVTGEGNTPALPFVVYINPKGEIIFKSSGYRIGIGESLLKAIRKS